MNKIFIQVSLVDSKKFTRTYEWVYCVHCYKALYTQHGKHSKEKNGLSCTSCFYEREENSDSDTDSSYSDTGDSDTDGQCNFCNDPTPLKYDKINHGYYSCPHCFETDYAFSDSE